MSDIKREDGTESFGYEYLEKFDKNKFSRKIEIWDKGVVEKHEMIIYTEKYMPDRNYPSLDDKVKDFRDFLKDFQYDSRSDPQIRTHVSLKETIFRRGIQLGLQQRPQQVESLSTQEIKQLTDGIQEEQQQKVLVPSNMTQQLSQHLKNFFKCPDCGMNIHKGSQNCPRCNKKF